MKKIGPQTQTEFFNMVDTGYFIIYFGADWCRECQYIRPKLPVIENEFSQYRFIKVDRDENIQLCLELNVRGLPSFIAYREGQEIGRFVNGNLKTQPEIEDWIRSLK
ncbi:thioredoxin [Lactiplantibacillus plantarum]|uniref:thioredoxin family protein n=1 Tax=Lactiplantibacillus plantarum TaxID=1590 RepID=UPI0006D4BEF8|nr:thioredoxin family protein [Lactiplantibacillus plantarum]ALG27117.1 thioredoxin [Lactiplantibacillus plantarum]